MQRASLLRGYAGTAAALAVTRIRPMTWSKRRAERHWCRIWRFHDVTVRLGTAGAAGGIIGLGARA